MHIYLSDKFLVWLAFVLNSLLDLIKVMVIQSNFYNCEYKSPTYDRVVYISS